MEFMENKLVILLGIVDYDDQTKMQNLHGIRSDLHSHYKLWTEKYGFDVFPDINDGKWYKKENWNKREINEFINESRSKLSFSDYDGLILCLFAHGDNDGHLITSDGDFVDIMLDIQYKFKNMNKLKSKLCIIDSCGVNYDGDDFITLSNYNLNETKCVEDPVHGGLFTQRLLNILSQKPHLLSSLTSLSKAITTSDCVQQINYSNELVERGLKNIELTDHGVLKVYVEHGTDIEIESYYISRESDPIQYENHMIGIILYQYEDKNEWCINNTVQCESGYIIIVNKNKLQKYLSNCDDMDYFDVLYQYRFKSKISNEEKNKYIGVQFEIINGTFKYKESFAGDYYTNKHLELEIFDEFNTMSGIERIAIRHILEHFKYTKTRSKLVKEMITNDYKNKRTRNIFAFKPLIGHNIDVLYLDLFSTQYLTEFKGIEKWGSEDTDDGKKTASKIVNKKELSIYFKSSEFQQHDINPYNDHNCVYYRHLRRLFIFSDLKFRSEVMKIWNNNNKIRIIDLCKIARKYEYIIDTKQTKFKGKHEIDYALYFVKFVKPKRAIKASPDINTKYSDNSMMVHSHSLYMDDDDDDAKDQIQSRDNNVSINNSIITIKSINGKNEFNVQSFLMSRFSDRVDFNQEMYGMVLYLYDNKCTFSLGGIDNIKSGYIYVKTRENIKDIGVMRNSWHDKLFKSLFNKPLSGRVFGCGFIIKDEEYIFDSSAFEFNLSKYYGNRYPDYGAYLQISEVEKRCIIRAMKNWKYNVRRTYINKMLKSKYITQTLLPPFDVDIVFKRQLPFCGPFARAYEIQSLHPNHDDKLYEYKGYREHHHAHNSSGKRKTMLFVNEGAPSPELKSLYIHGLHHPKGVGEQVIAAIVKKYRIMNFMKLEYICDIATQFDFTVSCIKRIRYPKSEQFGDDIKVWMEAVMGKTYSDFFEDIRDGVELCKLLNKIKPGFIAEKKFKKSKIAFIARTNIQLFIEGSKKLGITGSNCIETRDLYDKQNFKKVVRTLRAVSDISRKHGFYGPFIDEIQNNEYALFLKYTGNTPEITNAMVVLLGISDYTHINNLNGVKWDMINHKLIWTQKYNYDIFPSKYIEESTPYLNRSQWTKKDIDDFCSVAIKTFEKRREKYKYDGMIVVISGHGSKKNTIITSDNTYLDIPTLVRDFADVNMKKFPRLFLIDCCRSGYYNPESDDGVCVLWCICGEKMKKMATHCYEDHPLYCDECSTKRNKGTRFYHCSNNIKELSTHSYLCEICADKKINDNDNEHKIDPICICGNPLTLRNVAQSYGGGGVECDVCGVKIMNKTAIIWHCSNTYSETHSQGYDICEKCIGNNPNTQELSIILYGNSPLETVSESINGGMFTNAVLSVLGSNTGTEGLFKLMDKMNITLKRSTKEQQIVSPEGGGPRMRKLILVSDNKKTVELKSDDETETKIDEINTERAAIAKWLWKEHKNETNNAYGSCLWEDSTVPYTFAPKGAVREIDDVDQEVGVSGESERIVMAAIEEFKTKTPVEWVKYDDSKHTHYVEFIEANDGFWSYVGCLRQQKRQFLSCKLLSKYLKSDQPARFKTDWWFKISVMHEMMHCLGFYHEFARDDWKEHGDYSQDNSDITKCIKFGQFDYRSIMNYPHEWSAITGVNTEYARLMDHSHTFSQGDIAALRRIYGKDKRKHFGEWHKACGPNCTERTCRCGACGKLPGGDYCGYEGMKGHWTCCMNEDYNAKCSTTHTGFWHMRCINSGCRNNAEKKCICGACGSGCTYTGRKAHWSCCNNVKLQSKCGLNIY